MTFAEYEMENFGYEVQTTFWDDFSIADHFGIRAIKDTFNRAFKEWRDNYKFLTELVIVLNVKCWNHYNQGKHSVSALYSDLYYEARDYALDTLKDEEFQYFYRLTD